MDQGTKKITQIDSPCARFYHKKTQLKENQKNKEKSTKKKGTAVVQKKGVHQGSKSTLTGWGGAEWGAAGVAEEAEVAGGAGAVRICIMRLPSASMMACV